MNLTFFYCICSVLFSFFATTISCYIGLATQIGPWMGPTLALMAFVISKPFVSARRTLLLPIAAGSIGGIVATALSFSFPTFYFLDPVAFNIWLSQPLLFMFLIASIILVGGALGVVAARFLRHELLMQEQLTFPVGQLVYKIIDAKEQSKKIVQLSVGFGATFVYGCLQFCTNLLPKKLVAWTTTTCMRGIITLPGVTVDLMQMPLFIAIGFIAGPSIGVPLLIGALSKMGVADPLQIFFFPAISTSDFMFAFASGIVLSGALASLLSLPNILFKFLCGLQSNRSIMTGSAVAKYVTRETVLLAIAAIGLLSWLQFSLPAQVYLVMFSIVSLYQIVLIAGKIGLALLGRFATFVLVPGLLLFGYTPLQITVVALFVELSGGVATDALFSYKAAQLAQVDDTQIYRYQLFGLIICAVTAAITFYLLVIHFQLGSEQLFAQRGLMRALLIQAVSFDYRVLLVGLVYGFMLKQCKVNPMLVLGGFLMPLSQSLLLLAGGCIAACVADKEEYEPLFSGIYAANAITFLLQLL